MDRIAVVVSIQYNDDIYEFELKSENGSVFFQDTQLDSDIRGSKSIYTNYVDKFGSVVATTLSNFYLENHCDFDHPHSCEFSDIFDALLIRLIRRESMSMYYIITNTHFVVQSTGNVHVLGHFFDDSNTSDYYDIIDSLH